MTPIEIKTIDAVSNQSKPLINKGHVDKAAAVNSPEKTEAKNTEEKIVEMNDEKQKEPSILKKEMELAVEKANRQSVIRNVKVTYTIDEETRKVVAKVVDSESEEVIRQIPPEEFLKLSASLADVYDVNSMIIEAKG